MKRRNFSLSIISAFGLSACGKIFGNENASNTINFWGMGREGEVVTELLPQFTKENPNIKIIVQQIPWSAAHEKLLTAFAGKTLPDIAQIGNSWLPEMVAIGAVNPISSNKLLIDESDYFQGIWNTNIIDGQLYGIPWYVDTRLLFYRKDILANAGYSQVPQTWAEFEKALKKIKSQIGANKYAILLPVNEYEPLITLTLSVDAPILKNNASLGNMEHPEFKKALQYYDNMFKSGLAPRAAANEISNIYDEFARGFFNFYISGPWNIGEFKRRLPQEIQNKWATAPMPGPNGRGASSAGGSSLVIMKSSDKKAHAEKLISFLSRPEIQAKFYELTGDLPARKSTWKSGNLINDQYSAPFYKQLEMVRPSPAAPEWERVAQEIRIVSESMVRGNLTVDNAAKEMNVRANKILEKRRWMLNREAKNAK